MREADQHVLLGQRVEPGQAPQGVHARERLRARDQERLAQLDRVAAALLDEDALGGVAPPAVGVLERADELGPARRGQRPSAQPLPVLLDHAPDAPEPERLVEPAREDLTAQEARHEYSVLQDAAIQVDHVERAVGSVDQVDGTKALVGRGQELGADVGLLGDRAAALVLAHAVALDEVAAGLGHEGVTTELGHRVAAIDQRTAGAGEARQGVVVAQGRGPIAAVDARRDARGPGRHVVRDAHVDALGQPDVAVARRVVGRVGVAAQRVRVRVVEQPPDVVAREPPLPPARLLLLHEEAVLEAEAQALVGDLDPVVYAVHQPVDRVLRAVQPAQPLHQGLALVRDPIPVGVARQEQLGRRDHEQAAARTRGDRARQHQAAEELRARVHGAVAVGVLEHADHAVLDVLTGAVDVGHVAAHLRQPKPTVQVEEAADRVLHQGLGRDQLDPITRWQQEAGQGLRGREHGRRRDLEFGGHIGLLLPRAISVLERRRG